jgi:hypothetical protein
MALVCHHGDYFRPQELPKKLIDYLSWLIIWGKATAAGEIGKGKGPAQNPPPLDGHSATVVNWYYENVTAFVRDHGLMTGLIRSLGLKGEEKIITLAKLNIIYEMEMRKKRNAATEANSA